MLIYRIAFLTFHIHLTYHMYMKCWRCNMDNYEKIIDKNNGIIYAYKLANYRMDRHDLNLLVEKNY